MTNRREKETPCTKCDVRQLALNSHQINWTNYSPPVVNKRSVRLTPSLCIAAAVVCTAILMCHHRAACYRCARKARKAQLAGSIPSGIPSTCSDYSGDVNTDACVQPRLAGWRQNATALQKQSLIVWLWCSSQETWFLLFCRAAACFSSTVPPYAFKHGLNTLIWTQTHRLTYSRYTHTHTHTHTQCAVIIVFLRRWRGQRAPAVVHELTWVIWLRASGLGCHSAKLL